METKISTKEILSTALGAIIFFTVFLNGIILGTNTPMLFLNDGVNAVLTIWTSISFLLLLFSFSKINEIRILMSAILLIFQIPSVVQLVLGQNLIDHPYYYPSSYMTIAFLRCLVVIIFYRDISILFRSAYLSIPISLRLLYQSLVSGAFSFKM